MKTKLNLFTCMENTKCGRTSKLHTSLTETYPQKKYKTNKKGSGSIMCGDAFPGLNQSFKLFDSLHYLTLILRESASYVH